MNIHYLESSEDVGRVAAADVAQYVRDVMRERGRARIIAATGASQFTFLAHLGKEPDMDWSRVTMFHLDEYIGLPADHPASFRRYLHERFIDVVHPGAYVLIDGEADPRAECRRVGALIREAPVDAAFVGIGENGHLAFNDPPADFETDAAYLIVTLDEACRRQQVGEGWFATVADVPSQAISMSVRQMLKSREIICVVPDARKARAVEACVQGDVSPMAPASILRSHARTTLYLDRESAALLPPAIRGT